MRASEGVRCLRDAIRHALTSTRSHLQVTVSHLRRKQQQIKERLLDIPAVQLVVRTVHELGADDASHLAAGTAYYAILSLFPLLLGLIALLGFFLPSETLQEELFDIFQRNFPGSIDVLERNIGDVIRLRGVLALLSIIGLFWSGSVMFGAIGRAVNRAWDIHRDRPFYTRKLRDMAMALGISVLFLLSLGVTSVFTVLSGRGLPFIDIAVTFGAILVAFLLNLAIFLTIYKFIPNTKTFWHYVWPGALLAAILFEIAKSVFVLYLGRFANYELVYGSVASIIILLVWIYISAFILILGAEFSSEYGRMSEGVIRGMPMALVLEKRKKGSPNE